MVNSTSGIFLFNQSIQNNSTSLLIPKSVTSSEEVPETIPFIIENASIEKNKINITISYEGVDGQVDVYATPTKNDSWQNSDFLWIVLREDKQNKSLDTHTKKLSFEIEFNTNQWTDLYLHVGSDKNSGRMLSI